MGTISNRLPPETTEKLVCVYSNRHGFNSCHPPNTKRAFFPQLWSEREMKLVGFTQTGKWLRLLGMSKRCLLVIIKTFGRATSSQLRAWASCCCSDCEAPPAPTNLFTMRRACSVQQQNQQSSSWGRPHADMRPKGSGPPIEGRACAGPGVVLRLASVGLAATSTPS
jgi:hypothetical protein